MQSAEVYVIYSYFDISEMLGLYTLHNLLVCLEESVFKTPFTYSVKAVFKGHPEEPENVAFMSCCLLYTGYDCIHYSLIGKMKLPFIDSDLIYRGVLFKAGLSAETFRVYV